MKLDLDKLEAVAGAATEGPWESDGLFLLIERDADAEHIATFDPLMIKALITNIRFWEALATSDECDLPTCPLCLGGVYDYEKDGEWIHENGEKCLERRPALSIKEKRDIAVDALKECREWGGSEIDCERIVNEALSKMGLLK